MSTPTKSAVELATDVTNMKALPGVARDAARELLENLRESRKTLDRTVAEARDRLGESATRAKELGDSYDDQAAKLARAEIPVHRNVLYGQSMAYLDRNPNRVEPERRPDELRQVYQRMKRAGTTRRKAMDALVDNGAAMKIVCAFLVEHFREPILELERLTGVKRATIYPWLGRARHSAVTDQATGRRTRRLDGDSTAARGGRRKATP